MYWHMNCQTIQTGKAPGTHLRKYKVCSVMVMVVLVMVVMLEVVGGVLNEKMEQGSRGKKVKPTLHE